MAMVPRGWVGWMVSSGFAGSQGTIPLAPREWDRSMFSVDRLFAKGIFSPKNGPVPNPLRHERPTLSWGGRVCFKLP
jgi:hypothetical protein